jgi:uncharacterized protein YecE (DUF72 family)
VPENLPLFDEPEPEPKAKLQKKLSSLAAQRLFVGTSSWKYPGWLGQIYTAERYFVRGRFSRRRFEQECLAEYAETFPVVCGDFSFYQFPEREFWHKLFSSAPRNLRFAFKTPEDITVRRFPFHTRYGLRAGVYNPNFLNSDLFEAEFLRLLVPYRDRIAVIIVEFGTFAPGAFPEPGQFADKLSKFLAGLPGGFRYAVEIRNPDLLNPAYLTVLRKSGVAHVFNSWTRMPPLSKQLELLDVLTADFSVARALLQTGRPYEQAVRLFSPYQSVQEPNAEVRNALRNLLLRAKKRSEETYIFVNNRLEGNAPDTIAAITDDL